jgi:hypothetical protein
MKSVTPQPRRLRKREILFALAMGGLAAGGAAVILSEGGSENGAIEAQAEKGSETYALAPFTEIATVGPQDVVVTYGETQAVRVEGSSRARAELEPVVVNGKLTIQPKRGFNWSNWPVLEGTTYFVTMPKLERVAVAGSGDVSVDRIAGESFEGTIAGQGELSIRAMEVERANFAIQGSGDVVAVGTARETRVSIFGSGEVNAGGLRSKTASVSIGGSGDVALTVDDTANVSVGGSGSVDISGSGRCSVTRYGSGEVDCEGGGGTDD